MSWPFEFTSRQTFVTTQKRIVLEMNRKKMFVTLSKFWCFVQSTGARVEAATKSVGFNYCKMYTLQRTHTHSQRRLCIILSFFLSPPWCLTRESLVSFERRCTKRNMICSYETHRTLFTHTLLNFSRNLLYFKLVLVFLWFCYVKFLAHRPQSQHSLCVCWLKLEILEKITRIIFFEIFLSGCNRIVQLSWVLGMEKSDAECFVGMKEIVYNYKWKHLWLAIWNRDKLLLYDEFLISYWIPGIAFGVGVGVTANVHGSTNGMLNDKRNIVSKWFEFE